MEAKLKEYRALRRRKELIDNAKQKLEESKRKVVEVSKGTFQRTTQKIYDVIVPKLFPTMPKEEEEKVLLIDDYEASTANPSLIQPEDRSEMASELSEMESFEEESTESWRHCIIKWAACSFIWLLFYLYFLKIQFGAVFFVISVLIGIYLNTRTRPKKKGEVSAYSVFNQNCVSIDGTLNAEQFEREIRFGAGSVRPI